jgi:hypothetical protein
MLLPAYFFVITFSANVTLPPLLFETPIAPPVVPTSAVLPVLLGGALRCPLR